MNKNRTFWRRAGAVAAIAAAVAIWRYESPTQAAASPATSGAAANAARAASADTPAPTPTAPGPAERRLDLDALRRSLAGRPDADAELQRIVAFARFRDEITAYGNGRDRLPSAERAALARRILDALPEHVARNEIVPVQAEALSVALLTDANADPATRGAAIQSMRQQWDAYARQTVGPSPARDPRYQDYARQSRDIVLQVQASVPDPVQQQAVIAQRLQALRVQLFDGASSSGAH
ncbi:phospholipase C accessory protein PlcR [Burkholderia ubonensis]|uniref:Phospholipase C accessory protein PlcR n=1 Tax=Burkholderia ubonensis TaxID=101571 RepID=A0A108EU49_9BURK|nr:phospholipase C accessory protein PlcR [Burkholderia ubonensis]AOK63189.1 phospholipase C accessory protein PlcR [Burkholderia ubonensis]KVS51566.1 phospholipase C accessory protein PlcR [Burkholderia ubonensis]KVS51999.1 phospholipase C accessory protein PlcR [Burkholderia ubonensis]KVS74746.1 phospholipase C accessory protein PlcR [Burkholderia ubonensis]KVS86079.1 phospholipase C accessory protein PlcR [Burkholderia ubonensis]